MTRRTARASRRRSSTDSLPVLGQFPLIEVLEVDRNGLYRQLLDEGGGGDDGATRGCLHLIVEDAPEDLRAGALTAWRPMLPRSAWAGRLTSCGVCFVLARSVRIVGRVVGSCPCPRSVV